MITVAFQSVRLSARKKPLKKLARNYYGIPIGGIHAMWKRNDKPNPTNPIFQLWIRAVVVVCCYCRFVVVSYMICLYAILPLSVIYL